MQLGRHKPEARRQAEFIVQRVAHIVKTRVCREASEDVVRELSVQVLTFENLAPFWKYPVTSSRVLAPRQLRLAAAIGEVIELAQEESEAMGRVRKHWVQQAEKACALAYKSSDPGEVTELVDVANSSLMMIKAAGDIQIDYLELVLAASRVYSGPPGQSPSSKSWWYIPANRFARKIEAECDRRGIKRPTRNSDASPLVGAVADLLQLAGVTQKCSAVRKALTGSSPAAEAACTVQDDEWPARDSREGLFINLVTDLLHSAGETKK